MKFWNNSRYLGVGFLLAVACVAAPQTVKADAFVGADGVMGQSLIDEETDPAQDYAWLSGGLGNPDSIDALPMLRASSYTDLFLQNSFTTVSDLNGSTYYHDSVYEDMEIFNGIDVSYWQADPATQKKYKNDKTKWTETGINWAKMHDAGADFAFVRAASRDTADASIYEDKCASAHISGAKDNDMKVGLYIFSQAINEDEGVEEADYVLNLIDQYGWDIDMPIVIDREAGRQTKRLTNAKLSKEEETSVVQAFADEITSAGYKAGVYASYSWYNSKMNADDLSDCAIWIARYNNMTTSNAKSGTPYADVKCDYEFWQYSSSKPSASTGYTGNLDKNFWYKDTNVPTENLKMSKSTTDTISLTWDEAADAEKYRVYRYNAETGKYAYVATTANTSYTDKNLQAGTKYQYMVRCMWTIGGTDYFGTYSSVITAETLPDKVKNVLISGRTASTLTLSWDAVTGVDGYYILKYNDSTGTFDIVNTVGAGTLSCKVEKLESAGVYRFKVQSYKTDGTLGTESDETIGVTNPGKVASLSVKPTGADILELSWESVENASGYQVYRLNDETGKYGKIATIKDGTNTSYTDKALVSAKQYSYKVRAYKTYDKDSCCGAFSSVVTQTTKPAKVQKVKISTKSSTVTLKWGKTSGATGYQIYRLNNKTKKYEKIATVKGEEKTSYTNKKLKKGSTYSYKVRAYKTYEKTNYYGGFSAVTKIKVK